MALINKLSIDANPKIDITGSKGNAISLMGYIAQFIGKEEAKAQVLNNSYLDNVALLFSLAMYGIDIIHELSDENLEIVLNKVEILRQNEIEQHERAKNIKDCLQGISTLSNVKLDIQ